MEGLYEKIGQTGDKPCLNLADSLSWDRRRLACRIPPKASTESSGETPAVPGKVHVRELAHQPGHRAAEYRRSSSGLEYFPNPP